MNKRTILIVDDEVDILEMYKEYFESEGLDVLTAPSGEAGLDIYKSHESIELIISDSHMGKMSGLDFLKQLSALAKSLPIFYLATGDANKKESELIELGVSRLVLKPFDLDEVRDLVKLDLKI